MSAQDSLIKAGRIASQVTEAGLKAAIKAVRAGARSGDIGAIIERAIKARGAIPIRNLTGHRMARYVVHAGQSIPNVPDSNGHTLREGDVYAIEPFSVPPTASGMITDGPPGHIYLFKKKRRVRGETAKRMLKVIQSEYRTLPFASRWIQGRFPGQVGVEAFSELLRSKCVYSYPQLVERSRAPVAHGHRDRGRLHCNYFLGFFSGSARLWIPVMTMLASQRVQGSSSL